MNQDVKTTDDVTHKSVNATYGVTGATLNIAGRGDFGGDVHADALYDSGGQVTDGNKNAEVNLEAEQFSTDGNTNNASIYLHREAVTFLGAVSTSSIYLIKLPDSAMPNFAYASFNVSKQYDGASISCYVTFTTSATTASGNAFIKVNITTAPEVSATYETGESTTTVSITKAWNDYEEATITFPSTNAFADGKNVFVWATREDADTCDHEIYIKNIKFAHAKD